ncbi:MAG: hypothetical protein QM477_00080 [Planctomycetota bacterium]
MSNLAADLSPDLTVISDIVFVGAPIGLELDAEGTGALRNVEVNSLYFDSNGIGLSAISAGANTSMVVAINTCRIADFARPGLLANPTPTFASQSVGIRIHAEEQNGLTSASNAVIVADINSLSVVGPTATAFGSMASTIPFALGPAGSSYLEDNSTGPASTRLIEIGASPGNKEHGSTSTPAFPFATVRINGCELDGRAFGGGDTGTGWDWAVHCYSHGPVTVFTDYYAGFDVTISGCTIDDFREGGILGFTTLFTRGLLNINGTTVTDSGFTGAVGARPYRFSGVYLESYESYMGVQSFKLRSTRNLGHGLFAFCQASTLSGNIYDTGTFVGLDRSQFNSNSANGIELRNYNPLIGDSLTKPAQSAVVGGTWNKFGTSGGALSLIAEGDEPMFGTIPIGQGYISNSQIYDNTEIGVHASISGKGNVENSVSNRLVNCYIWSNPGGGYRADLDPESPNQFAQMPSLYFPIIHSTLVGNGDISNDFSVEIDDLNNAGVSQGNYEWVEGTPLAPIVNGTKFLSSIFDRDALGSGDNFGPVVNALMERDLDSGALVDDKIGTGGIRAIQAGASPIDVRFSESTMDAPPYDTSTTNLPDRWFLANTGNFLSFNRTLFFVSVLAPEATIGFSGNARPGGSQTFDRDKGGVQVQ